jgi:hypothetical protein
MTDNLVNLNKARKAKAKAEKDRRAMENRAKFGVSKRERLTKEANEKLADKRVEGHRLNAPKGPRLVTTKDDGDGGGD